MEEINSGLQEVSFDSVVEEWGSYDTGVNVSETREAAKVLRRSLQVREPERGKRYAAYLRGRHWKRLRWHLVGLSKGKCEFGCGRAVVDVHHMTYERLGEELDIDLLAVCRECHTKIHSKTNTSLYPPNIAKILAARLYAVAVSRTSKDGKALLAKLRALESLPEKQKRRQKTYVSELMSTRGILRSMGLIPTEEEGRAERQRAKKEAHNVRCRKNYKKNIARIAVICKAQENVTPMTPRRRPKGIKPTQPLAVGG